MATIARLAGVPGTEGVGAEDEFPSHDEPSMKWQMLAAVAGTEHLLVKYERLQTDTEIGVEDPLSLPARESKTKKTRARASTRAKTRTRSSKVMSRMSTRLTRQGRYAGHATDRDGSKALPLSQSLARKFIIDDDDVDSSMSYVPSTRAQPGGRWRLTNMMDISRHVFNVVVELPILCTAQMREVDDRMSPMRSSQRLPLTTTTPNLTIPGTPTPTRPAPRVVVPATPFKVRAIGLDPRTPPAQIQSTTLPPSPSSSGHRARALPDEPVSQGTRSAKKRKPVGTRSAEADFEGLKHVLVPTLWVCKLLFAILRAAFASPLETEAISQRRLNNILTHFGHLHETYGDDSAWSHDAGADFQGLRREMVDIVHELWDNVRVIRERINMFNAASPSIPRVSVLVRRLAGRLRVLDLDFARSITDRNEIVSSLGANLRGLQAISSITEENLHGWQIMPAESPE
ncbi:hypothetical protein LTR17_001367 [Elasticomyces elasticus]|nr:hypothetical protein LTR17_001367 [Elasticomyces elasticus]